MMLKRSYVVKFALLGSFLLLAACSTPAPRIVPTKKTDISAYNPEDYPQALAYFKQGAAHGDANAMNNLGRMYEDGRGVPRDSAQAVQWFTRAANAGNSDAALSMGVACLYGNGVAKDKQQACSWFHKAKSAHNRYAEQFIKEYC